MNLPILAEQGGQLKRERRKIFSMRPMSGGAAPHWGPPDEPAQVVIRFGGPQPMIDRGRPGRAPVDNRVDTGAQDTILPRRALRASFQRSAFSVQLLRA